MDDIYYCRRIWKESNPEIEKGDVDFIKLEKRIDVIARWRIFKSEVKQWGEFKVEGSPMYQNREEKIEILLDGGTSLVAILSLEEFDKVMMEYSSSIIQFKQN